MYRLKGNEWRNSKTAIEKINNVGALFYSFLNFQNDWKGLSWGQLFWIVFIIRFLLFNFRILLRFLVAKVCNYSPHPLRSLVYPSFKKHFTTVKSFLFTRMSWWKITVFLSKKTIVPVKSVKKSKTREKYWNSKRRI